MKGKTDTHSMAVDLAAAVGVLRDTVAAAPDNEKALEAQATVETFCAVALRVIAKTHPAKVREEARLVEIQSHMRPGVKKQ